MSANQVNFLVPPDVPPGPQRLRLITPKGTSSQDVDVVALAPALFTSERDGRQMASPQAVRAGQVIELWAPGLGDANPPLAAGTVLDGPGRW